MPLEDAVRRTLLDRLGHELNEAQARRQQLAAEIYRRKQALLDVQADLRRTAEAYEREKRALEAGTRDVARLEIRLNHDLQAEEALRARLQRARAGGSL